MRYNPPPNWPQPPADWTPPPGWEPDPSWPRPPSGWELWVAEDEFLISPFHAAASRTQSMSRVPSMQPWHRRTLPIVLLLIFVFPVGLVLLWLRPDWSVQRRGIITGVVGVIAIIVVGSALQPPTTTTAPNPVAAGGPASAALTPTSSPSATPSAVATLPALPTIVVTTPPVVVTTAPAVVAPPTPAYKPPPAPVHTAKAPPPPPQPVQTAPQQQSCYPLTSTGKCYTPGEYCRDGDHGASGIDSDGDAIKCEDNNGWRWERG